ncbi:MAG: S9 family peptidase [Cyclobacteriaceae bacterium]
MFRFLTTTFACLALSSTAQTTFTIEDIYQGRFRQETVDAIRWMKDGSFYTALEDNKIIKYDIKSGSAIVTLVDGDGISPKLEIDDYRFSSDESKLLIMTDRMSIYRRSFTAEYYIYDLESKAIQPLSENGEQSYATFAPDGSKVAFVRNNNLFYTDLDANNEVAITASGKFNELIHGSSDWVYEEEFSITKTFFWAPDSKKIGYISFDESAVKEYNLQLWSEGDLYPVDYRFKYPKAGEMNSEVTVNIFNIENGEKIGIDIGDEKDIYIPRMQWTKDANVLSIIRMNRLQNQLEILHADAASGKSEVIYTDKSETYLDIDQVDDLTYLNDGKHFITSSEQSGFKHLYTYNWTSKELKQITNGDWGVTDFLGIEENKNLSKSRLYYLSTEASPLDRTFYQISLSGKNKTALSPINGTSDVDLSSDFKYFILNYENATTPLQVSLNQLKSGKTSKLKDLEGNEEHFKAAETGKLVEKEFYKFKTADGQESDGYFLKPANFDPSKKYPVLIFQYSGPGSQEVANDWQGSDSRFLWHQMLTQLGYIVSVADTRSTGYRGVDFQKVSYKQLGKYETEDHIAHAKYLGKLPFIEATRIGIWGWSYGGYASSLAMFKGDGVFKTAIAVAPVTTWRFYDTIYTERYLQRPQDNPSGYDDNSPITHASKLEGNFLLVHGTGDDNVHFQNTVALQNELILHGKQFESFYYPNRTHGIGDYNARVHLYNLMTDFILKSL